jgi:hypothetical protein
MKKIYYFLNLIPIILLAQIVNGAGILTGPTLVCKGTTTTYFYDDENSKCSNLEWEVYENGVRKTTGISSSSNFMNVTWSTSASSGQVRARGMNEWPLPYMACGVWQDWKSLSISFSTGNPLPPTGPTVFCNSGSTRTRTWTVTPSCPTDSYTWEVPSGWTLTSLNSTNSSVSITAPTIGSGTFNIRVKANLTAGNLVSGWTNRQVQLGKPISGGITNNSGSGNQLCPNGYYALSAYGPPGTTFSNWTFSGDLSGSGSGSTANINTYSSFSSGHVTVTLSNECGSNVFAQTFILSSNCSYFAEEEISIYPNPINDSDLNVEWPEGYEVTTVSLLDDNGKYIQSIHPKDNKVKFKNDKLSKGEYYIHLQSDKKIISKRIIKE